MSLIPSPPDLKPTIIQMQNNLDQQQQQPSTSSNNEDSIDPKYIPNNQQQPQEPTKRKRRRSSSSLISQNEIEKRRKEHKTAHSIIEKKRRIRMNREFEALKYLIPACRNNLATNNNSNNNGEGMYKLTILQATVDYIKYLHQVINIQQDEINSSELDLNINDQDLDFAKIDVDTDSYRNLEIDYDFNKLFKELNQQQRTSDPSRSDQSSTSKRTQKSDLSITKLRSHSLNENKFQPLPSPLITPELFPKSSTTSSSSSSTTPLANYKTVNTEFQFQYHPQQQQTASRREFQLPKPAISNTPSSSSLSSESNKLGIISELGGVDTNENSASNVLLSMKRDSSVASIKSLLN